MRRIMLAAVACILAAGAARAAAPPANEIHPVRVQDVTIGGSFWGPRLEVVRGATLGAVRHQCDITGRLTNFDKAAAKIKGEPNPGEFEGLLFNDSDVYKTMEGWAAVIATEPDAARRAELDKELDALVDRVAAAQYPDGYIDTYYTLKAGIDKRLTRERWDHETYCMGHLIEAGAVHFELTGKRNLLGVSVRAAEFLRGLYGSGSFTVPPGHEEAELALIKLAEATGEEKFAELAHTLVECRGRAHRELDGTVTPPWGDYAQDQTPAADLREASGHAVRAGYYYSALADLARLGHAEYRPALDSVWDDVTRHRIFITGGIGPSARNEGFTEPYDIPVHSAYQETCASIALCLWAHRMFLLEGDAKYMEQFERTVYNAVLAGLSLDGTKFFYVNPMLSRGGHTRQSWFECACCPPNVLRFFGELGQYAYAAQGGTVYVNLYMQSKASVPFAGGTVELEQTTGYPFDGEIAVAVMNKSDRPVTLALRGTPGMATIHIDSDGYGRVHFAPHEGGTVRWCDPMTPQRVYADPRVKESVGRVAIMRGPLVYAAESIDNSGDVPDLGDLVIPPAAAIVQTKDDSGTPLLIAEGMRESGTDDGDGASRFGGLYRAGEHLAPTKLTMRPYFMWDNRGDSSMRVWLPESAQFLDPRSANGARTYASHVFPSDTIDAAGDGVLPDPSKGSGDQSIPRLTFWPHTGSAEWVRYDFDHPRKLSKSSVYWFDDTGVGGCRVPRAAVLEYKDGSDWKPVRVSGGGAMGVAKDVLNTIMFDEVETISVRLRIELQAGESGGILEWSVGR